MTEKEKMLSGKLYLPTDEELTKERDYAKKLCHEFNVADPTDNDRKKRILKKLLRTDEDCTVEPNFYCDYGYNIIIGKNFYANHNCVILDVNTVEIGDNVFLGPGVQICAVSHPIDFNERIKGFEYGQPIKIGDNVWIGGSAIIIAGVKIGNNSVIGAGSIVVKNIPPDVLAAGNPCRVIRKLWQSA
jgi:maltose O-acetyltransferase